MMRTVKLSIRWNLCEQEMSLVCNLVDYKVDNGIWNPLWLQLYVALQRNI